MVLAGTLVQLFTWAIHKPECVHHRCLAACCPASKIVMAPHPKRAPYEESESSEQPNPVKATPWCILHGSQPALAVQVEMNTVASSFGCLSTIVSRMHRYTTSRDQSAQPVRVDAVALYLLPASQ